MMAVHREQYGDMIAAIISVMWYDCDLA